MTDAVGDGQDAAWTSSPAITRLPAAATDASSGTKLPESCPTQLDAGPSPTADSGTFLRFRLTYIDSVQSAPWDLPPAPTPADKTTPFIPARRIPFAPAGCTVDRVPEIRIFGATDAGQRCCVHVHGTLPYVYVEYQGRVTPDDVQTYVRRLARAVNVCMAASLGRRDPSKSQFVAFIVPVKGIPFYGFHVGYRYFLKIYCLDPKYMTRVALLLRSGEIMQSKFTVYESHIPFLLQFMLDCNLYGCGWVDISRAKFREPVPEYHEVHSSGTSIESDQGGLQPGQAQNNHKSATNRRMRLLSRASIPAEMMYATAESSPSRVSHSALEFDIHVSWINNRHLIAERNLHANFTEFLNKPIPDDYKFVHSVRELWEDEKRRRVLKGLQGPLQVSENSAEFLGGLTAGPREAADMRMFGIDSQPPWQAHSTNEVRFKDLLAKDRKAYAALTKNDQSPDFQSFAPTEKVGGWMERIQTSFKSVEALFEETMERDERESNPFGAWGVRGLGVSVISASEEASIDADVDPKYLAQLQTQMGRARLLRTEEDDVRAQELGLDVNGAEENGDMRSDGEDADNEEEPGIGIVSPADGVARMKPIVPPTDEACNDSQNDENVDAVNSKAKAQRSVPTDPDFRPDWSADEADLCLLDDIMPREELLAVIERENIIQERRSGFEQPASGANHAEAQSPHPMKAGSAKSEPQIRHDSIYSPKKRNAATSLGRPSTASTVAPVSGRVGPARISPTKSNMFSPAKSKLRNVAINPAFVTESRAKRKREDDLVGFRAIGDHGRTKLQQMLDFGGRTEHSIADNDVQRLSKKSKMAAAVLTVAVTTQAGAAELSFATDSASEQSGSSSSDEQPNYIDGIRAGSLSTRSSCDELGPEEKLFDARDVPARTQSPQNATWQVWTPTQLVHAEDGSDVRSNSSFQLHMHDDVNASEGGQGGDIESEYAAEILDAPIEQVPTTNGPAVQHSPALQERTVRFASTPLPQNSDEIRASTSESSVPPPCSMSVPPSSLSSSSQSSQAKPTTSYGVDRPPPNYIVPEHWRFAPSAPAVSDLLSNLDKHDLPHKVYRDAYWSESSDMPSHPFEYAGRRYVHRGDENQFLPEFLTSTGTRSYAGPVLSTSNAITGFSRWEYALAPPSRKALNDWLTRHVESGQTGLVRAGPTLQLKSKTAKRILDTQWKAQSQVQGPTQANPFGAKYAQAKPSDAVMKEKEHMSSLGIELHINTRGDLLPDPSKDEIQAIFYCLQHEDEHRPDNGRKEGTFTGYIASQQAGGDSTSVNFRRLGLSRFAIDVVDDEIDLIRALIDKVREWDPEIFTGYDVLKDSWGYLVERAEEIAPELDIVAELSRVLSQSTGRKGSKMEDRWGYSKGSTLRITGRHVLPVWRLLKSDANLTMYSLENVCFHILHQRVPRFSHTTLTSWYISGKPGLVARVMQYHIMRVQLVIDLLEEAEIVSRNAEFARVFGVDFHSVLTRGSQFKVESVMFKISKPENFMLPSPSREDVGRQNAAECMPLILEPESGFYSSPVLVFDFQSLYPSVMIAYNLCYSTCLGRIKEFMGTNRLGTSSLAIRPGTLSLLEEHITISPNGMMFVKPQVRRSLLAKMLTEILDTRVMVKKSMKLLDDSEKALERLLNARQLGLKFIANVTYGYTSATFSGRMPCVEVADAIVQTGRETLERAKNTIQSRKDWGAIVRYGDTDSLFVHLPGKSKEEAFVIGNEIADTITSMNPKPVKLKFEKVYLPCFLLAKKRYVGFKYEHAKQQEADFDAKGIETVRRDGFPAMQKMVESCIKILFRSSDLSAVKVYVQQQFSRMMQKRVSAQDFIYAKEVKMGSYSDKGIPPPGAVVTGRRMLTDPRTEALYGERVPYVITKGVDGPNAKQAHRALTPEEFLANDDNALDDTHYIERIVKALNRLLNLVGVDTQDWWNSTPRKFSVGSARGGDKASRLRLDQHFESAACPVCSQKKPTHSVLCSACLGNPLATQLSLNTRLSSIEARQQAVRVVCATCSQLPVEDSTACDSIDCGNLYARVKADREVDRVRSLNKSIDRPDKTEVII